MRALVAIKDSAESADKETLLFKVLWYANMTGVAHQDQLVKGLLLTGSLFVIFGESNCGKTFLMLDVGLAISAGLPWRGLRTRRGLVIYIAGEGAASVRARVAAYRQSHPEIAGGIPFAIVPSAVDFLNADSVASLIATIQWAESECGEKTALIIVDTFARAMPGGDENSAQDVGLAVASADRIRVETGAAVCLIHHCGKDPGRGARGSSSLRAATDSEIMIEGQAGTRTAIVTKQRDLQSGQRFEFNLQPVDLGVDDEGDAITSCVVSHVTDGAGAIAAKTWPSGKRQQDLLRMIEAEYRAGKPVMPSGEIARIARERLGMAKSSAFGAINGLEKGGWIIASVGGMALTSEPAS